MNFSTDTIVFHKIDAARNMARFYALALEPNLFGGVSLRKEWGRLGRTPKTVLEIYGEWEAAEAALSGAAQRRLKRGYVRIEPAAWSTCITSSKVI